MELSEFNRYLEEVKDYLKKNYGETFIAYVLAGAEAIQNMYNDIDFKDIYFDKDWEKVQDQKCRVLYIISAILEYTSRCNQRKFKKSHEEFCELFRKKLMDRMYMIVMSSNALDYYKKYAKGLAKMLFRRKADDPVLSVLIDGINKLKGEYGKCYEKYFKQ